jgi:DNA topoisomerase-3
VSSTRESDEEGGEPTEVAFSWRRNHLFDLPIAMILYEQCIERPMATVIKVETKPTSRWKPLPLTTVELQQSGSRLLGMTPKRVLDVS